jgi:DNA polymerase-3 subunit gamma/tau
MTAIASGDGPGSFQALDKVIHSGQDPRRFAEDLLEFTRDIIVVGAAGSAATALLPGTSAPVIEQMTTIASSIGGPRLSAIADVINDALMAMTGATSPKLHLELLMARLLVSMAAPATPQPVSTPAAAPAAPKPAVLAEASQPAAPQPVAPESAPAAPAEPLTLDLMVSSWGRIVEAVGEKKRAVWTALADTEVVALVDDVVTIGFPSLASAEVLKKPQGPGLPPSAELVRDAILAVSGHRVRFKVQALVSALVAEEQTETVVKDAPAAAEATAAASWPTVTLPGAAEEPAEEVVLESVDEAPEEAEAESPTTGALSQVGEAVIREVLGGQLISEHPVDDVEGK